MSRHRFDSSSFFVLLSSVFLPTMNHDISLTFNPIGPWPVLLGAAVAVTVLTLWAYSRRLKGTAGRWRLCGRRASFARLVALSAGGPAAIGVPEREKKAKLLAGRPGRHQHEHDHRRRGPRADAVGRRHASGQAGEGFRQDAGARSRPQVLRFRLQAEPSPRPGSWWNRRNPRARDVARPGDARSSEKDRRAPRAGWPGS